MTNAFKLINDIIEAGASDVYAVKATLEDGAALAALGITDDDQEAVEVAHRAASRQIKVNESMDTAKDTIAKLYRWEQAHPGRNIEITWQWLGREREGLAKAFEDGELKRSMNFRRGTAMWKPSDTRYNSCHTGSRKHKALMHLAVELGA